MNDPTGFPMDDYPAGPATIRGNLTTSSIALLIVAAAAPLGVVVGAAPVAFMLGNGPGLVGAFLLSGLVVLCFAVGYSALIRDLPGAGAFFNYLSVVFGRRVGTGSALVALASYLMLSTALAVGGGYFVDLVLGSMNVHIGWKLLSLCFVLAVAILGRSNVDLAARFLVPLVLAEFGIILLLAISIVSHKGLAAFPYEGIAPAFVFTKGFGFAVVTGLSSFIGIESAALYVLEARDPGKAIPRATLGAVIVIGIAYLIAIWAIVGDIGARSIQALATKEQGELVINVFRRNTGEAVADLTAVMLCSSIFACYLALHNAATRYVFTLAEHGTLPRALAVVHPERRSPSRASLLVTVCVALTVGLPILCNVDAYSVLYPVSTALGTVGIITLQAGVAIATVIHFRRKRDPRMWVSFVYPAIGTLGLLAAAWLITDNYHILTNSHSVLVNGTPLVLVALFFYGILTPGSK
ncbi:MULTISPECIES: APC family permease [Paraburkholderia]|uniref:APC family permease n=1 Tax=Paraburkholderia TaxID=1822464 RepID=UPI00225866BD|nr:MULTISPECIES: APC family permease [Paraburkholderia]MCX4160921.1 APC family permease [Paraburkholderia megapolitana]MDN7156417.1 APC family permease [Paraburkholderia sp. CHISQ3]MDQ6493462.1 APC family permease [Paraburkholderia megapolitana]